MKEVAITPSMYGYTTSDLKRICVYAHYIDDQIFYVGEGNIGRAFTVSYNNRSKAWVNIVCKNPDKLRVEIFKIDISKEEAIAYEKELISKYGRLDLGTGCLVNCNNGDSAINVASSDNWGKDKRFYKNDNPNYGNKYANNPLSIPIVQLDILGRLVRRWDSAAQASEIGSFDARCISGCCSGKRNIHKGYQWFYSNEYDPTANNIYKPKGTNPKIVVKYKDKKFVKLYNNNEELLEDGLIPKNVSRVANGYRNSYKGFHFYYFSDLHYDAMSRFYEFVDPTKI